MWACGDGWPQPALVEAQRGLALAWLQLLQHKLPVQGVAEGLQVQVRQLAESLRPVPLLEDATR